MEDTFRFKIDLGYADNIELWIEIPEELHQRISVVQTRWPVMTLASISVII